MLNKKIITAKADIFEMRQKQPIETLSLSLSQPKNINPLLKNEAIVPQEKPQKALPKWMRKTHISSQGKALRKRQKLVNKVKQKLETFLAEHKDKEDPP